MGTPDVIDVALLGTGSKLLAAVTGVRPFICGSTALFYIVFAAVDTGDIGATYTLLFALRRATDTAYLTRVTHRTTVAGELRARDHSAFCSVAPHLP